MAEAAMKPARTAWQSIARRVRVPLGFVFAALFLWLARPDWRTLLLSLALVVPGLWLRGYAAGYVRKNAELTSTGPYAHTRNPLYLGSLLMTLGFGLASGSWLLLLLLGAAFAAIYIPVILGEELYLRSRFPGFDAYAAQVPRLLPRLRPAPGAMGDGAFSPLRYRHHREYRALLGVLALYASLLLRLALHSRSQS